MSHSSGQPPPTSPTSNNPIWQPDEDVHDCPLCTTAFTWWTRKHHCRKCGRVVCNACASNNYPILSTQVVRPPNDTMITFSLDISPLNDPARTEEVRTCDGCFSRLEQDRCRRMLGLDITSLDPRVAAQIIRDSVVSPGMLGSPPPSYSRLSALVPSESIPTRRRASSSLLHPGIARNSRRRRRVSEDEIGSSSVPYRAVNSLPTRPIEDVVPLRYVSFELTEVDKMVGDECPICFEEYETGQKIARLECWCVFHVTCIRAWKDQKQGNGGCPLHFHD